MAYKSTSFESDLASNVVAKKAMWVFTPEASQRSEKFANFLAQDLSIAPDLAIENCVLKIDSAFAISIKSYLPITLAKT